VDEAIAAYRAAIRLRPEHSRSHNGLGGMLRAQGKLDEAIAEIKQAIRLMPGHAEAHNNLGIALDGQGKLDEAIAEFRTAIRIKPDDALSHSALAWRLVLSPARPPRDYDEGLQHARKAVELAPKVGGIVTTLALAEYRSSHHVEAIAAGERAMALRNGGNASDWFILAMAHWQKGDRDEARKWLEKTVTWTKGKAPTTTSCAGSGRKHPRCWVSHGRTPQGRVRPRLTRRRSLVELTVWDLRMQLRQRQTDRPGVRTLSLARSLAHLATRLEVSHGVRTTKSTKGTKKRHRTTNPAISFS
jgi:Flp pilus assembly protein TadD